jgi:hypothetical protein
MNTVERDLLRQAIDARTRERLAHDRLISGEPVCAGCGCELTARTTGCKPCGNRANKKTNRGQNGDARRAYEREYSRRRRAEGRKGA